LFAILQADTQLVSILYRTHKSLPTAAKVSSLYVFDALARAARHRVVKENLSGDVVSEKGNCATFLLKIEGVLDGLFQDMATTGTSESKVSSLLTKLYQVYLQLSFHDFAILSFTIVHCVARITHMFWARHPLTLSSSLTLCFSCIADCSFL
jgi:hypothetical protein